MRSRSWFALVVALALAFTLATARCARDVPLGVAPASDGSIDAVDTGDAGAPD